MWEWTLNWGTIRDDLIVGSCPRTPEDAGRIRGATAATALLSLQTDVCRDAMCIDVESMRRACAAEGLALVNVPMRDFDPPDQRRRLPAAITALHQLLDNGHRVYVHCTAGINRAPLTVLAYLVFVEMQAPDAALALIRAGRPGAEPYRDAFDGCWSDLTQQSRAAVERHAYALAQRDPAGPPDAHWFRAEREVVRAALLAAAAAGRAAPAGGARGDARAVPASSRGANSRGNAPAA